MKKILFSLFIVLCLGLFNISSAEIVIYNPNSKIYHKTTCHLGGKCKVCKKVEKAQAVKEGARPCKVCGK